MDTTLSIDNNFTLKFLLNTLKGTALITIFHLYGEEGSMLAFKGKVSEARKELSEFYDEIVVFIEPYLTKDEHGNFHPAFTCEIKEIFVGE